ncbi:methyltransferase domain-containing protein [Accumulibacter sp.]|uniref:methyltransferase domain-containing protein n=1 Tax=Accumulibacter sp. TaxID=2053492 RepID=UPI002622D2D8|nr:methyltransferase domain-containing protein [Accumulibacter sp.]
MNWDPEQYLKFVEARRRPALDLLVRMGGKSAASIVDLGCGTGNITQLLAEHWPAARIVGIDSDQAMLEKASATASPPIEWRQADIATWQATDAPDLIFSNAALHWLDDHRRLLPSLIGQLAPGGVLAVQMPANFNAPSHRILLELAGDPGWQEAFEGVRMGAVLPAAEYHDLLTPLSQRLEVWETTYWQALSGDDAVVEWMKGTTLVPYLARLDMKTAKHFLAAYRARLAVAYPRRPDGHTLFPFKRIFLIAQR